MVKVKCVFCNLASNSVLLFSQENLEQCLKIRKIRAEKFLKGSDLALPAIANEHDGYHSRCLSSFKALPKRYFNESLAGDPQTTLGTISWNSCEQSGIQNEESSGISATVNNDDAASTSRPNQCNKGTEVESGTNQSDYVEEVCVFCLTERKKIQGRWQYLSRFDKKEVISSLKTISVESGDVALTNRITSAVSQQIGIYYHHICKVRFINNSNSPTKNVSPRGTWHDRRDISGRAFERIVSFVEYYIVVKSQMHSLKFLKQMYSEFLREVSQEENKPICDYPLRRFEERLLSRFKKGIAIINRNSEKFVKPYSGIALHDSDFEKIDRREVLSLAAIYLREDILSMTTQKLPEHLTATNLMAGECTIPEEVAYFNRTLLCGESSRRQKSAKCQRIVESLSQDMIFNVSYGRVKTSKHITLVLATKGLTNSKKMVSILNRYGHCCSYSVLEGLETEATFSTVSQSNVCPEDILKSSYLCTGVAFDNFDRFVDTDNGKETLHDTVGIIFQNVSATNVIERNSCIEPIVPGLNNTNDTDNSRTPVSGSIKRRRIYDSVSLDIPPYFKKPKVVKNLLPLHSPIRSHIPLNLVEIRGIDFVWMISHALELSSVPMWVGFNALIYKDDDPQQIVSYLTTINKSPTSTSVVQETMIRSLQVADECYEPYAQVTYDLAIAKIAFQLQITEKPRFDRVFIHLGMFHVMMAYCKSVGKFIDKSGLTSIMVDSGLLAEGSVNSFLTGKHFNRCKRLHPLVALSLEILHFRSFLEDENVIISESVNDYLKDFANNRSKNPKIENDSLNKLFEDYEIYKEKTINGDKGKTAQYFAIYINIIHYYFMLNRSIRTADFELLKFVLPKIANLFFVFNQQNYSRYSVLYLDNVLQVDMTHPGLKEKFLGGSFGIKRTSKPFSRQPIDLTLEQTINADAGNKLTGIVHSTNSLSARQRWCINHSTRTKIITHVVEYCGLKSRQDVTADLGKSRIKKSAMQINKFLLGIESSINPFQSDLEKNALFNISTGRAASQESEFFLLNIESSGNKLREKFNEECVLKEERFESPIKKNKVYSFMGMAKKKIKIGTKITEVKMQRDLFGKLLGISLGKALDFEKALSYPLTPVPLAFCHIDGGICKTNKAMLLKKFESEVNHSMPPKIDVMIIDGFFLLHTMENLPLTFRNISKQILLAVLRTSASTVILSFDQYFTKSIKDTEHFLRGTTRGKQYQLLGPEQERPSNFRNELKNINFKEALVKFLIKDWENNEMAHYIGNKTLYVNASTCVKFQYINDKVLKSDESSFSCPEHEESDTKMVFHACKVEKDSYVVIRCSDTDILMIMLGNMQHVKEKVRIWIDAGTGKYRRFIDVTKLYEKLGSALCSALPAFHAFTGCDFNPSFYRKGKLKPFNILRKNTKYIKTFSDLSLYPDCDLTAVISGVEIYVCEMYGLPNIKELNKARVEMFFKTYRCEKKEKTLDINVRNFDGSSLPPCKSEIMQHALRSAYIGNMWCNAHKQSLSHLLPEDCGWEESEGKLNMKWFQGEQLPNISEDILFQEESDDESTEEDSTTSSEASTDSESEFEDDSEDNYFE